MDQGTAYIARILASYYFSLSFAIQVSQKLAVGGDWLRVDCIQTTPETVYTIVVSNGLVNVV